MKVKNKTNHKMSEAERAEKKFDRDLKSCMKCHYFWGNDSRCMNSQCYKEKKAAVNTCLFLLRKGIGETYEKDNTCLIICHDFGFSRVWK